MKYLLLCLLFSGCIGEDVSVTAGHTCMRWKNDPLVEFGKYVFFYKSYIYTLNFKFSDNLLFGSPDKLNIESYIENRFEPMECPALKIHHLYYDDYKRLGILRDLGVIE